MKKNKILIIRGLVTAGKSTTSHELAKVLPGWIFIDVWKIKEMFEPLGLEDRTPLKNISKKAMVVIMKEVMKTMRINILVQETSIGFINRKLKDYLRKYNYEVHSFFLDVNVKDAVKRDIQREKPTMHVNKRGLSNEEWKKAGGKVSPDKEDIIINTSEKPVNEVVKFILKSVGEKAKKHPFAHAIRKSW